MEQWRQIKECPDYDVSEDGKIKNRKTGRIMKTQVNERGYEHVCLRVNKRQVDKKVHRLVADSFYDGDHSGLDVNHIDGNKLNNHISNLEFCTRQTNIRHAFDSGLKRPSRMIKVRVIETGKEYESIRECARSIGVDQSMICQYLAGTLRSVNGYHFEKV